MGSLKYICNSLSSKKKAGEGGGGEGGLDVDLYGSPCI